MCRAYITLTSGLFSCTGNGAERGASGAPIPHGGDGIRHTPNSQVSPESTGISVPLFAYGDGFGAFGCVSVTAPMFLSEDEAAAIINSEAERLGVTFDIVNSPKITGAAIPETSLGRYEDLGTISGELDTDGHSEELGISYEFVSRDDYREWEAKGKGPTSTVSLFDIKDAAARLAENNPDLAVFYDPLNYIVDFSAEYDKWLNEYVTSKGLDPTGEFYERLTDDDYDEMDRKWSELYDKYQAITREQTEEDLRAQVRDFIMWLTAQGVI